MTGATGSPSLVLAGAIFAFMTLVMTGAVLTQAWEANDEPDHVRNVQSLVDGRLYRSRPASGSSPLLPALGLVGTLIAIRQDVIRIYL